MSYTFIYKNNNDDDRDAVKYIEIERIGKLECGHYFPQINFCGACFSGDLDDILKDENTIENFYENITTILSVDDFKKLARYNKNIKELGYGLDKQPEKIEEANKYFKEIENVLQKLKSEENEKLFEKVVEEEKEILKNDYMLTDKDIENIFDFYYLDYRDRAIICGIYEGCEHLADYYLDNFYNLNDIPSLIRNNLNYYNMGLEILEDGNHFQLEDGRIVELSY